MDDQFYVRIRGRIQGPYDTSKLQSLVRRGQLSRMHEVSQDRNSWRQAADFPELFVTPAVASPAAESGQQKAAASHFDLELDSSHQSAAEWYYAQNQEQKGPITFEQLRNLLQSGALTGSTLAWKEGMPEWAAAEVIPGLRSFVGTTGEGGAGQESKGIVDNDTLRTMRETIPWVSFLVITIFTVSCLLGISGIILVLLGVREKLTIITAGGLFSLAYTFVGAWGGLLLHSYNSNIRKFLADRTSQNLDSALKSLKAFWMYLSILLIIFLVNVGSGAIWSFSVGISLSELQHIMNP